MSILREYESEIDGRGVYIKLLQIYEGKHNLRQVAIIAMSRLNSLYYSHSYPNGMPAFIAKFREALQDLRDANEPVSDVMAKSMLLSKINDNYRHIMDVLMASSETFEECVLKFLDKFNLMNQCRNNDDNRQANKVKGRGSNRKNHKKGGNNGQDNQQMQDCCIGGV